MRHLQRSFASLVSILFIVLIVVLGGAGVYYYKDETKPTNSFSTTAIPATSTPSNNSNSVNKASSVNNSNPPPDSVLKNNLKVTSEAVVGGLVFDSSIDGYLFGDNPITIDLNMGDKKNQFITIKGNKLLIQMIEAHSEFDKDYFPYDKKVCTSNSKFCYNKDEIGWIILTINGSSVKLAESEIKKITFSNGTEIYLTIGTVGAAATNYRTIAEFSAAK